MLVVVERLIALAEALVPWSFLVDFLWSRYNKAMARAERLDGPNKKSRGNRK